MLAQVVDEQSARVNVGAHRLAVDRHRHPDEARRGPLRGRLGLRLALAAKEHAFASSSCPVGWPALRLINSHSTITPRGRSAQSPRRADRRTNGTLVGD